MTGLLDPLFRSGRMREIFSDRGRLQGMLDFEAALARAAARTGVIPRRAGPLIAASCRAERFDCVALARGTVLAGNPAAPMVQALTAMVAKKNAGAARYVHWGATSQDAIDTGAVLQLRAALDLIEADVARVAAALARSAKRYSRTPMAGRTLLQQAVPITFGLKAAGALSALERSRARLRELRPRVLVIQFGGAAGTLASLGTRGLAVGQALAAQLELRQPEMPWHAHRDRVAEVATVLGLLTGTLGKIARDLVLLAQTEIAEARESAAQGKGRSSAMPHKRNPVDAAVVLAAATKVPALVSIMLSAMTQEHERGLGNWPAEWETLPEICLLCSGALEHVAQALEGLEVDVKRMRANLAATRGLIMAEAVSGALAPSLGRAAAHALVDRACQSALDEDRPLRDVLTEDAKIARLLSPDELDRLLDPVNYLGVADKFVERVLAARTGRKK